MKQSLVRSVLGGISAVALSAVSQAQIKLNEIYISHSGTDLQEMIELKGPAGASLDHHVVCVVEGDYGTTGAEPGKLDRAWDLTGFTIPTDGYFVLGVSGVAARDFTMVGSGTSGASDALENGTETFYIVNCGSSANAAALVALIGTDIDAANAPDDDLATSIPTLGTIVDSIAVVDCGYYFAYTTGTCSPNTQLDRVYDSAPVIGADGACSDPAGGATSCGPGGFFPAGIFRGLDAPNPWCPQLLDFNEAVNTTQPRTPGAVNSVCPSAATITNYCTAGTTTNNCNATMSGTGTPSVSATSGFTVAASTVEGQKQGLIFYSVAGQNSLAWGTGSSFLCIKSPTQRTPAVNSGGTVNQCDGALSVDFLAYLAANPGAIGGASNGPLSAGNQVQFQCWFRDPPASKSTSLSDGLEVTMVP